jgi:hypothetical protein
VTEVPPPGETPPASGAPPAVEGWAIKCEQVAGFLIPRPCRQPASGQCSLCQKPICPEHTVALGAGQDACTACAARQNVGPAARQRDYWDYYGYDDAFYGWGHRGILYTGSDYQAFDQPDQLADATESLEGS